MTGLVILLALVGAAALLGLAMGVARVLLSRDRLLANAAITNLCDHTTVDAGSGALRSVQAADLRLSEPALGELWSAENLERLASTYWRFLTRVTLGLVRVRYTEHERFVVLLFRPLTLLSFRAPEYEIEADHGLIRWRIERGLLVARAGRESKGHLQIDVRRLPGEGGGEDRAGQPFDARLDPRPDTWPRDGGSDTGSATARLHIEVEVANFHPAIASGISLRLYNATQSRIHVIVTHGFLRSLARLDLAKSRVGRLAAA